jgi:hypothetical protein
VKRRVVIERRAALTRVAKAWQVRFLRSPFACL